MPIRMLPPLLISQIAAGEVIERPASVVKELIENSLDAGATRIEITIEEGGRRLIRITDDGAGIPPDELQLAITAHATSKLTEPDQLASIATLGFRGEALASIASVSRLRITTRHTREGHPAEHGTTIDAHGDQSTKPAPAACAPGTVVEVADLFVNTPARRKFMRAAPTEFGHISDTVTRIAIARPDAAFKLSHNDRTVLDAPANQSDRDRCIQLLGKELDNALLDFDAAEPASLNTNADAPARVTGLAGIPAIARGTTKFQYLAVNGRPIRDRRLAHAVKEAYRGLIPHDKHPVVVAHIQIDHAAVDVNAHPAKTEVRFHQSGRLHGLILTALRQRLLGTDLTPSASLSAPPTQHPTTTVVTNSTDAFVDYFKRMAPEQKGFDYQQIKHALTDDDADDNAPRQPQPQYQSASPQTHPNPPTDFSPDTLTHPPSQIPDASASAHTQPTPQHESPPSSILQVHNSYLVTQDEQGLLIVDQHALHERVMFEQLLKRVLQANLESQRMLTPAVIHASPARLTWLQRAQPLLTRIGIEADPIGPDAIAIHAFPSFLFDRRVDPADFLEELLDHAEEGQLDLTGSGDSDPPANETTPIPQVVEEAVLHKVLDMMACKAAVKAGDRLSAPEQAALLAERERIERSASCPHGRPTSRRLTIKDMEKFFHRR